MVADVDNLVAVGVGIAADNSVAPKRNEEKNHRKC